MTEQSPVSIDDVRTLVSERHRFDEWLAALEARRADTPEHVYGRVHGDYVARRDRVLAQLYAEAPSLAEMLAGLDLRASELAARMGTQDDERTEAMLRHAVGEYDDAAWQSVRERVEASLQELGEERSNLEAHRDDVRGLLEQARPPVEPDELAEASVPESAPESAPGSEPTAPDAAHVASGDRAPEQDEGVGADAPSWLTDTATPASTHAVPDAAGGPSADAPAESEQTTSGPARERTISITETLAAIEADVVDPAPRDESTDESVRSPMSGGLDRPNFWRGTREGGVSRPEATEPDHSAVDVFGDATSERGGAADSGPNAPADAFDELAFLRSVIDPQAKAPVVPKPSGTDTPQKTLRCTECGTMNLPTEWYCERCGGELAAF